MVRIRWRHVLVIGATMTSLASGEAAEAPRPARDRPNIIIILADDLAYRDLGCFGQRAFATPHTDRMAAEGRIFTNAYAGAAWCAPSRTALLTGLTDVNFAPLTCDAKGIGTRFRPTIAELLRPAGYATCAIGKWHMAEPADCSRDDQPAPAQMPWHRGFDTCRIGFVHGFNCHFPHQLLTGDDTSIAVPENHKLSEDYFRDYYGIGDRFTVRHHGEGIYNAEGLFVDQAGNDITRLRYAEDLYREAAESFIAANRSRPFLLYYASSLVHFPIVAKRIDGFADRPATWTTMHKAYAASVQEFDRTVGAILNAIRTEELEHNTIVLVTSDNGFTAGFNFPAMGVPWGPQLAMWDDVALFANKGPWNRGKHINTAGGLIVPFIAWGPGRVPPGATNRVITFTDVLDTARELSGTSLLGHTDGTSFVPLLEGRDDQHPPHSPTLWSGIACHYAAMNDDWAHGAVPIARPNPDGPYRPDATLLDERWFAMGFRQPEGLAIRLFDLVNDPGQQVDIAVNHPELCQRAAKMFDLAVVTGTQPSGFP